MSAAHGIAAPDTPSPAARSAGHGAPAHPAAQRAWKEGVAHSRAGRHGQAAGAFERAVTQAPRQGLYWLNLASTLRKLRRLDPATDAARRAFDCAPDNILACQMLAELLRLRNRNTEALRVLESLDAATPRNAQHQMLTGAMLLTLRRWSDAAACFLNVLAEKPAHVEAYSQLGFCLANLQRHGEAAECFRTITLIEPHQLGAAIYAAHYAAWACDWTQVDADQARLARALELQASRPETPAFSPFCLLSMNDDAAMHLEAARIEARRIATDVRNGVVATGTWQRPALGPAGYPRVAASARKRIGFVSADFRTHATSMLLVQVLEKIDRGRFEIALYSHGHDDRSPLRARMVAAVDDVIECGEMGSVEQAQRIRDDGVAILVDMSGYTQNTRLSVFALRPAPVQVLWLAYPSTTGSDFVDYIVGDPVLTPLDHQSDFSERIAQLPVCYEPTDRERAHPSTLGRADCGLPESAFVFACFNQSYKITDEVFGRWCRILERTPGSVLWLLVPQDSIRAQLLLAAQAHDIGAERIVFAPFVTPERHLARLARADLFLDTFPYGAHTTCCDALWMGLPVLTQIGRSFSARVAASLLSAVGLPDLAVPSAEDYEELAVRIATDAEALAAIRSHLADNRLDLPLFDSSRFSAELSDLFARMVDRWQQGLPPAPLPAATAHPFIATV